MPSYAELSFMFGNLIGRAFVIGLFAYILWYVFNKINHPSKLPEERRYGRVSTHSRYGGSRYGGSRYGGSRYGRR